MGKVMVTGALGNVGGYVVKYLLENGESVVCADISIEALSKKFTNKTINVYFDFTDPSTFTKALDGVDRVFIMRPPHLGKPEDLKPFIDALKNKGNIQLVSFLSLIGIENNPIPPHYKIEKYIEKAELPFCHIRPSFFMQNISGIHAFEIKEFNRIVVPVKKAFTSFIDAEDIRGLDKEYSTVMSMLYMMTRMGTAKKVTSVYKDIMGKEPQTFRQFAKKNINSWNNKS